MKRLAVRFIAVTITTVTGMTACDSSTDPVCTRVGCTSGLTVVVEYPATADFTVVANDSDGETRTGTCSVTAGDPCQVRFDDFLPDHLTVSVTGVGQHVSVSLTPSYEINQPNGPECTPTCWNASVRIELQYEAVPEDFEYMAVSTGRHHACALALTGRAYCWGANSDGELGDGSQTNQVIPVPVATAHRFESISAGYRHTCGLNEAGRAFCWGQNGYGQLGDGTNEQRLLPSPVAGDLTFESIHAGYSHTCALTPAGQAYCWGSVMGGEPGLYPALPTAVAADLTFRGFGSNHSLICGLTEGHSLYCWGGITATDYTLEWSSVPLLVDEGLEGYRVAVGRGDVCALTPAEQITCWLGDDAYPDVGLAGPYLAAAGMTFASLASGEYPLCGITAESRTFCWRVTLEWRFDRGPSNPEPVPFTEHTEIVGVPFVTLSHSSAFGCGLAPTGDDQMGVYCWGENRSGQLGNGSTTDATSPVVVQLP